MDFQQQVRVEFAAQPSHQIIYAKRHIHPADNRGAQISLLIGFYAMPINRQIHHETQQIRFSKILDEGDVASDRHFPGFGRPIQGNSDFRDSQDIET